MGRRRSGSIIENCSHSIHTERSGAPASFTFTFISLLPRTRVKVPTTRIETHHATRHATSSPNLLIPSSLLTIQSIPTTATEIPKETIQKALGLGLRNVRHHLQSHTLPHLQLSHPLPRLPHRLRRRAGHALTPSQSGPDNSLYRMWCNHRRWHRVSRSTCASHSALFRLRN